jgi:hypothetical protein
MFEWIKMMNKDFKNHFAMTVFSWKKWLVGKLASHKKSFANYKKINHINALWVVGKLAISN